MVIVNIQPILKQLNDEVKTKIIQKQDELFHAEGLKSLEERFANEAFLNQLLQHLSTIEKKYFPTFIRKYSLVMFNKEKEEQTTSTEEKLALLLLRQKGLLYEVKNVSTSYMMPIEIIETYFHQTLKKELVNVHPVDEKHVLMRNYLFLIIEMLFKIKEKKIKKNSETNLLNEDVPFHSKLLLNYLLNEGLVKMKNHQLNILESRCDLFFKRSNDDIKKSLTLFFLSDYLKDPYIVFLIRSLLFKNPGKKISLMELENFTKENSDVNIEVLNEVLQQLTLLNIIVKERDHTIFVLDETDFENDGEKRAIKIGVHEILVPIHIELTTMWNFRCWGRFVLWEQMVHLEFTNETINSALKMKRNVDVLLKQFEQYLPGEDVYDLKRTFNQWIEERMTIEKKENLTLYELNEGLHLTYVKEHWQHWWAQTEFGVVIEKERELNFELLLKGCSLTIIQNHREEQTQHKHSIEVVCSFPKVSTVLPELDRLPKQWFKLTAYDEKTTKRTIKQAMILQLPVQLLIENNEVIELSPKKIEVKNGNYVVSGQDQRLIEFKAIKKVAIVHPLDRLF